MGKNSDGKLDSLSVWALAAGGMVGGGIYTVLGVVIAVSAQWTWLSFVLTGLIAIPSAYSYVFLTIICINSQSDGHYAVPTGRPRQQQIF